jgi:hypothetical protein
MGIEAVNRSYGPRMPGITIGLPMGILMIYPCCIHVFAQGSYLEIASRYTHGFISYTRASLLRNYHHLHHHHHYQSDLYHHHYHHHYHHYQGVLQLSTTTTTTGRIFISEVGGRQKFHLQYIYIYMYIYICIYIYIFI